MPQVPVYQPQVQEQALPNARFNTEAPLEAFGGGQSSANVFGATQALGQQAEKMLLEEKQKADDLVTQDAYAKTVQLKNKLIYDPNDGAILRKGKDALGVSEEFGARFDKEADDIQSTLTADQRQIYSKIRMQQKLDLTGDLERHTSGEYLRYQEEVLKKGVDTAQDDAVLSYSKPVIDAQGKAIPLGPNNQGWNQSVIEQKLGEQKAFILSHASRNKGMSGEAIKAQLSKAYSDTHYKVILNMLDNGKDLTAQRYFEANKDQITDGETLSKITKDLKAGVLLGEAQRATDKIFTKTQDLSTADNEARKIEDPKLREKVQHMVLDRSNLLKNIADARRTQTYKSVYDKVVKGAKVDDIPRSDLRDLAVGDEENLRSLQDKLDKRQLEKTSSPLWYELRNKLADPINGDAFAKQTNLLVEYGDKLTPEHMADLTRFQNTIMEKKAGDERDAIWGRSQMVESTLNSMHITDEPSQSYVRLGVDKAFREETQRNKGVKPDGIWVQKTTDRLAREALKSGKARQTWPKPPAVKVDKYNTPENNKIVSDEIGSIALTDKKAKQAAKAIDAAVGAGWETAKEAGRVMTPDELRKTVRVMSGTYVTKVNSAFGVASGGILGKIADYASKDTEKRGYEIKMEDVPPVDKQRITKALTKKGLPANDRSIVYYYIKGLAAKKAANGGK